jgi:hypothetical protein
MWVNFFTVYLNECIGLEERLRDFLPLICYIQNLCQLSAGLIPCKKIGWLSNDYALRFLQSEEYISLEMLKENLEAYGFVMKNANVNIPEISTQMSLRKIMNYAEEAETIAFF